MADEIPERDSTPADGNIRVSTAVLGAAVFLVFLANAHAYFFLCDDAFISFRYSRHLVDGLGLVWNPGEVVEGYTNFLWVLIVAAGLGLGVGPEVLTPILGWLSGALILVLLTAFGAGRWGWRDPWIWLAPGALVLSRTFTAWCSGGLETQFFSLGIWLGLWLLIRERAAGAAVPWRSSLCLTVATLVRPEGGLFALAAGLCLLADVAGRRRSLGSLLLWTLPFWVGVGSHWLWRRGYYGFWLPNTFTAKVNGFWWDQSLRYFSLFLAEYRIHWFAPLIGCSLWFRRDFTSALFATSAGLYLFYLACIGGGHIGSRFLVPILPILYWLVADGVHALVELRPVRASWAPLASCVPRLAAVALSLGLLATTHWGSRHSEPRENTNGIGTTVDAGAYGELRIAQGKALRALIDAGRLPADLRIETGAAGALPYYTDWYVLDKRGLNDLAVARQPLRRRGPVAHEHTARLATVREREIAVVMLGHELLVEGDARALERATRVARQWMALYNRAASAPAERLRFECRRVGDDAYLVFGTNLAPAKFEAVLGSLASCTGPGAPVAAGPLQTPRNVEFASKHSLKNSAIFSLPAGVRWIPSPPKYSWRTAGRGSASKRAARSQRGTDSDRATSRTIRT